MRKVIYIVFLCALLSFNAGSSNHRSNATPQEDMTEAIDNTSDKVEHLQTRLKTATTILKKAQ